MNDSGNPYRQSNTGVNRDSARRETEPISEFVPNFSDWPRQTRETKPGALHDQSGTHMQDLAAIFANVMTSGWLTAPQLKLFQQMIVSSTPAEMTADKPSLHVSFEGSANPGNDAPQDDQLLSQADRF